MTYDSMSRAKPEVTAMERELLGTMLLTDGKVIPLVNSIVTVNDFYAPIHQTVFSAIINLYERGITPNLLSLIQELKETTHFDKKILAFVAELGEAAFSTSYAEPWAKKIKEYSIRRKLLEFSIHLNQKVANDSISFDDVYLFADSALRDINSDNKEIKPMAQANFLTTLFKSDRDNTQKYSDRKTGFSNIDDFQIFSPGLYLLGATPACGKTTFAWQLLNQLAERGELCFFCSYEMARFELFSKSLARELFKRDRSTNITAADIRNGATSNLFYEVFGDLAHESNSVQLFEIRDETVDDLLRILRPYCNGKDKSPVVCVDYLQIIPPSNDLKLTTDKARIDDIVHKLKTFQRETNTTFIIISSFNRVNYYSQVSFESFKDSGNIEYTADVVWALQMFVANTIKDGANISATRKKFDEAKKHQPRAIQLKCLKNRQGNNYDCYFNYYSAHDFFEPATLTDFEAEEKAAQGTRPDERTYPKPDSDNYIDIPLVDNIEG